MHTETCLDMSLTQSLKTLHKNWCQCDRSTFTGTTNKLFSTRILWWLTSGWMLSQISTIYILDLRELLSTYFQSVTLLDSPPWRHAYEWWSSHLWLAVLFCSGFVGYCMFLLQRGITVYSFAVLRFTVNNNQPCRPWIIVIEVALYWFPFMLLFIPQCHCSCYLLQPYISLHCAFYSRKKDST